MINILRKRIMDILASRGWSVQYFAELVEEQYEDISAYTVENICRGKTADPRVSTLLAMSNVLGHSINCLMGQCPHTKEEKEIILYYRQCGVHGKSLIHLVAKHEATVSKKEREADGKHRVPCLIPKNRVDEGFVYEGCGVEEIETTIKEAYAAIEITNNAYTPTHCKGDRILLADRYPEHGERAVFVRDGVGFARDYFEEDKKYILRCIVGHREDIVLKRLDEVECIGTCVGVIKA